MRLLTFLGLVVALLLAACGGGTDPIPVITQKPPATQPVVTSRPTPPTASAATTSTSGTAPTTTSMVTTTDAAPQRLIVGTAEGVMLWRAGVFEPLVESMPCRVAFQFGDGTVVYQESRHRFHDGDPVPVLIARAGGDSEALVALDGTDPTLWGVGEIDGNSVVVYERWLDPCGWDESLPACEGRLLALSLKEGTERDLGAFSAPGYALGPSAVQGGIVLNYNSGAEIGEVGTFLLRDLDGHHLDNPVCISAVDCSQPMRMLGALSPEATELAFVLDRMAPGTETEYEIIDRRYGVVDVSTGESTNTVELDATGRVVWLDFNGERGLVSVSRSDTTFGYLISDAGAIDTVSLGGIATFPRL